MSKLSEVQVELASKTITVRKLPLGKYSELLKSVDSLPGIVDQFTGKDNDAILAELPQLITQFLPEFTKLISIATAGELSVEEVENEVGLDEAIEIITAAWEVNNFSALVERVKKLMARQPKVTVPQKPEQSKTQTNG